MQGTCICEHSTLVCAFQAVQLQLCNQCPDDAGAGGGSVTFGAPMVLYSEAPAEMYKQLHALAKAAQGRAKKQKLQHHNFVNNADAVPRFLGGSLNAVHQAVESYVPSMSVSKFAFPICSVSLDEHALSWHVTWSASWVAFVCLELDVVSNHRCYMRPYWCILVQHHCTFLKDALCPCRLFGRHQRIFCHLVCTTSFMDLRSGRLTHQDAAQQAVQQAMLSMQSKSAIIWMPGTCPKLLGSQAFGLVGSWITRYNLTDESMADAMAVLLMGGIASSLSCTGMHYRILVAECWQS